MHPLLLALSAIFISTVCASLSISTVVGAGSPIVTLTYGVFQGAVDGNLSTFLGVPFAKPAQLSGWPITTGRAVADGQPHYDELVVVINCTQAEDTLGCLRDTKLLSTIGALVSLSAADVSVIINLKQLGSTQTPFAVYTALAPHDVNVAGGRVSGVGVAGFRILVEDTYHSWKTNQLGLTGIVTQFTLKTVPQGQVWGGLITYTVAEIPAVSPAVANFAHNVADPKAAVIPPITTSLDRIVLAGHLKCHFLRWSPPAGIFDEFLAIKHLTEDVSTRDFVSLVQSALSNTTSGTRAAFHIVSSIQYTPTLINAILTSLVPRTMATAVSFNSLVLDVDVDLGRNASWAFDTVLGRRRPQL
ncbi:hypothetical protein C8R47DRAFT_1329076 [Mycena vitilis]|nr:hypothetical protein C8R47DRAFT_1329076 [Mycena vitilis]